MQATVFAIYPIFKLWSFVTRKYFSKAGCANRLWHTFGIACVVLYQIGFVVIFTTAVVYFDMAQVNFSVSKRVFHVFEGSDLSF
jgi:hypothetical protein